MGTDKGTRNDPTMESVVLMGRPTYSGGKKHSAGMGMNKPTTLVPGTVTSPSGGTVRVSRSSMVSDKSQKMEGTGC